MVHQARCDPSQEPWEVVGVAGCSQLSVLWRECPEIALGSRQRAVGRRLAGRRVRRRLWSGASQRSEQHTAWLRKHLSEDDTRRKSRTARRAASSDASSKTVFNADNLAQGHKALSADDIRNPRMGGKTWDPLAVHKRSYLDIRSGAGPSSSFFVSQAWG